ncbi:MAG: DUF1501 domain-containing protein [Granulosicoccus sp.]
MSDLYTNASRREFLKRTAASAATGIAAPLALNLSAIGKVAAAEAQDYKALVCVFLYGANDHYNTIVPYDLSSHRDYARLRQGLAIDRNSLSGTVMGATSSGQEFAFSPHLTNVPTLWRENRVATLMNVGPLIQPTSKAQFDNKSVLIPPKIFSHNDQQSIWQSLAPEGASNGWGGRFADIFLDDNDEDIFSSVSISGNALYLSGRRSAQYTLSSKGSIPLVSQSIQQSVYRSPEVAQAMESLMLGGGNGHLMAEVLRGTSRRALDANEKLTSALSGFPDIGTSFADDPKNLGAQLRMVARMIAARSRLGVKRQVFFVSAGGFDLHDGLIEEHPPLLDAVGGALHDFYRSTEELGVQDQVTSFTASDFGRTLSGNRDGSDHGWGSHHLIVGGAVNGGQFYGQVPVLADDGPDDVGRGRLLPTTSVEQFAATLGKWFGASDSELHDVLPRLSRFAPTDLGFMRRG